MNEKDSGIGGIRGTGGGKRDNGDSGGKGTTMAWRAETIKGTKVL